MTTELNINASSQDGSECLNAPSHCSQYEYISVYNPYIMHRDVYQHKDLRTNLVICSSPDRNI